MLEFGSEKMALDWGSSRDAENKRFNLRFEIEIGSCGRVKDRMSRT